MELGAYGLRFDGNPPESALLTAVRADAPLITLERCTGSGSVETSLGPDRTTVGLAGGGSIDLDRSARRAAITTPQPLTEDELAHPYLAPIAAVHNHWLKRAGFHAGGVVIGEGAWGVVGGRQAGKSTLLAALSDAGAVVLADDLLVMDGSIVYPGPRTLDLRAGSAAHFADSRDLGVSGARRRWRLDLGPAPESVPLRGWIILRWGDQMSVERESGSAAAHHLAAARSVSGLAIEPAAFIAAAAQPAVVFTRPQDMSRMEESASALIDELDSGGD